MLKGQTYILITVILLIFVGQAIASVSLSCNMPAEMMMQSSSSMNPSSKMNHGIPNHDMSKMTSGLTSNVDDCCSDNSNCNMSSCISLALPSETQLQANFFSYKVVYFELTLAPRQQTSSLYRPPILG